jgi:indoleamine 2,3-dioxygenase
MKWQLHELGFLPMRDPAQRLSDPAMQGVEKLSADLPRLVYERRFRQESADYFAYSPEWGGMVSAKDDPEIERLFMLFSYFASAYAHAPGLPPVERLPAHLSIPLVRLAQKVHRPPILSYASYCLHNWRRVDPAKPVELGNIELLQNFSLPNDGKADEDWFILVHVDIEARAGAALQAFNSAKTALDQSDANSMRAILQRTAASLHLMNRTLDRMPERCSADVYFNKVRPYIFGFNDIIYEGCFGNVPQSYRGETGAQSSIVPTLLMALGIRHKSSLLTNHLEDMQNYMPPPHRQFIHEMVSVRDFVAARGGELAELYNDCLRELIAFRSRHFEYAVNYIEKKVENPLGTGGTPYVPWLLQLIEETTEFYLVSP